jgi:hypothetical protein
MKEVLAEWNCRVNRTDDVEAQISLFDAIGESYASVDLKFFEGTGITQVGDRFLFRVVCEDSVVKAEFEHKPPKKLTKEEVDLVIKKTDETFKDWKDEPDA